MDSIRPGHHGEVYSRPHRVRLVRNVSLWLHSRQTQVTWLPRWVTLQYRCGTCTIAKYWVFGRRKMTFNIQHCIARPMKFFPLTTWDSGALWRMLSHHTCQARLKRHPRSIFRGQRPSVARSRRNASLMLTNSDEEDNGGGVKRSNRAR